MNNDLHTENLNIVGNPDAPIVVVVDTPSYATFERGEVMSPKAMNILIEQANQEGLGQNDFVFITPCPPMPESSIGSAKREGDWLARYHEEFTAALATFRHKKLVVYQGANAGRQVHNRPVKITKVRGKIQTEPHIDAPILPSLSPGHVMKRPEVRNLFDGDWRTVGFLKMHNWRVEVIDEQADQNTYEWCLDIQHLLDNPPRVVCVDTEYDTYGKRWYNGVELVTVQLSVRPGHSFVCPVKNGYYPGQTQRGRAKLLGQIRELLGNPAVAVTGHNFKSDLHVLRQNRIEVANWNTETVQLCFVNDDNMVDKGLDEATRRFIPELAGYADVFNTKYDKNIISRVPLEDMLKYGGGDTDAGLRLAMLLTGEGMRDTKNWNCYRRIQMPALRTFFEMEQRGLAVNVEELGQLGDVLHEEERELNLSLMERVPVAVKRKHLDKGLKFSRPEFVQDILFSEDGFGLTPVVFTKGTRKLGEDDRIPSTSTKEHLPFFDDNQWVMDYIKWKKLTKMQSTYVGRKAWTETKTNRKGETHIIDHPDSGFWKYLSPLNYIHPTFDLHVTTTGRSNSRDPNAQNFPKRGRLAKAFRKIFVPRRGWVLIEADLSQAELRIAAWMSQDPTMLAIYRAAGDIHTATAAAVMGVPVEEFKAWKNSTSPIPSRFNGIKQHCTTLGELYDFKRFQAKAINFGFLYGMGWAKFMVYAKTDYGITFTEQEAQDIRETFFRTYYRLSRWHEAMRDFVNKHGYVRALHGGIRRLPSIYSHDKQTRGEAERQAINSPVQRFASDLGLIGMTRFGRDCDWNVMRPLAFIHDAVVVEARIGYEEEAMSALKWYMQTPPLEQWFGISAPIPIVSDVSMSETNLAEMHERSDIIATMPDWCRPELDEADAEEQLRIYVGNDY